MLRFSLALTFNYDTWQVTWPKIENEGNWENWWRIYFVWINKLASTQANVAWRSSLTKCECERSSGFPNWGHWRRRWFRTVMFASATGRNLYLPRVRQPNPCQPLGLKCPTLSQWQEWTLLVQFTPGWRSLSLPKRTLHYLPVPASTRAVHLTLCRDLSSAQFQRALKDLLPGEDALWPL